MFEGSDRGQAVGPSRRRRELGDGFPLVCRENGQSWIRTNEGVSQRIYSPYFSRGSTARRSARSQIARAHTFSRVCPVPGRSISGTPRRTRRTAQRSTRGTTAPMCGRLQVGHLMASTLPEFYVGTGDCVVAGRAFGRPEGRETAPRRTDGALGFSFGELDLVGSTAQYAFASDGFASFR